MKDNCVQVDTLLSNLLDYERTNSSRVEEVNYLIMTKKRSSERQLILQRLAAHKSECEKGFCSKTPISLERASEKINEVCGETLFLASLLFFRYEVCSFLFLSLLHPCRLLSPTLTLHPFAIFPLSFLYCIRANITSNSPPSPTIRL